MTPLCVIKQPAGLGDIIFCQKIARAYREKGYHIIWPVPSYNLYLNAYLPGVEFVAWESDFPHKDIALRTAGVARPTEQGPLTIGEGKDLVLDLTNAHNFPPRGKGHIMAAKFQQSNVFMGGWQDDVRLIRHPEKEDALLDTLGIASNEAYALVNRRYSPWGGNGEALRDGVAWSPNKDTISMFPVDTNLRQIELSRVGGFTLFDWACVLEQATEIWTMDTSSSVLADCLETQAKKHQCFSRRGHYVAVRGLLSKKWSVTGL